MPIDLFQIAIAQFRRQEGAREAVAGHLPEVGIGEAEGRLNGGEILIEVTAKIGWVIGIDRDA